MSIKFVNCSVANGSGLARFDRGSGVKNKHRRLAAQKLFNRYLTTAKITILQVSYDEYSDWIRFHKLIFLAFTLATAWMTFYLAMLKSDWCVHFIEIVVEATFLGRTTRSGRCERRIWSLSVVNAPVCQQSAKTLLIPRVLRQRCRPKKSCATSTSSSRLY